MEKNSQNHNQAHSGDANARNRASNSFRHIIANRNMLMSIACSFMLFLLMSCEAKVQKNLSVVSVSGIGSVLAQPDMVQMNVNISHTASTTKEAKKAVDQTMQQLLKIFQEENIEDKFIQTVALNYEMEYDYRTGRRVRIGQSAQQTMLVTVNDILNKPERFSSLLDKITAIDRVEVQNIQFDIENKTELFRKSRELAYQKAFDKAKQYASLSGREVGKVLTISEGRSQEVAQTNAFMNNMRLEATKDADSVSSSVPTGNREITSEINVTFSLK
ncbi:MAG: SIMPL domain-containing protein [Candidatus Azobacteroides sp.]|nr:SIMPL domain-containing protein [Candidatus Azobacteroides sp.]